MARDNQDRASERAAEREADIAAELQRIGRNPNEVDAGTDSLGSQHAESGAPDGDVDAVADEVATSQEETQELPDEQQEEQWEHSGGDEELAEEAVGDDES